MRAQQHQRRMVAEAVGAKGLRSSNKVVAANSAWQFGTFAARAFSGIMAVVLIARAGGPHSLGVYQFALTFTAMFPFYYGIPSLLAREVARRPEEAREWVETGTLIALLTGGSFLVLFVAGVRVVGASHETALTVSLAALGMVFDGVARVQFSAFWAWERMRLETLVTILQEAAFLVAIAVVLATGGGVQKALLGFTASRVLGAVVAWLVVGRRLGALPVPRAGTELLRRTFRRCTPFAVNDTLTLTYMRADAVMLGIFKGPVAVGLYQAGTNLVLYLNVLARCINYALYPRMSKAWPDRPGELGRLRDASFRLIGVIAMPITVGSLLLAPRTFRFLYGPRFDRAVLTYQLLVVVVPIRMLGHTLSLALSATDRQTRRTIAVTITAAANVLLNLYFIQRWSYVGAAITTIICETELLFVYALFLRRIAGRSEMARALSLPTLACLPLALAVLATRHQQLSMSIAAGGVAYVAAMLVFGLARASGDARQNPRGVLTGLLKPSA